MQRSHRRRVGVLAAGAGMVVALAGCVPTADNEGEGDTTLDVVAPVEPVTLNSVRATTESVRVIGPLYDALIGNDAAGQPDDSGLVVAWDRSSDVTWDLELREGVTFHDGSAFTAEDVAFTIEQVRDDPSAPFARFLSRVAAVEVTGDHAVTVTTVVPDSSFPALLTAVRAIPSDYYAEVGADGFEREPVGTGPFAFGGLSPGQSLTLDRFDDYWAGPAEVERVRFTWSGDAAARVSLLQSGGADVIYDVPSQSVAELSASDGTQVASGEVGTTMVAVVRANDAPTDDASVREAISLAVDRDLIVDTVYGESGVPQKRFFSSSLPDAPGPEGRHDAAEAARLVATAGDPEIVLTYTTGVFPQDKALGEAVAGMLTTAGLGVQQEITDNATIFQRAAESTDGMNVFLTAMNQTYPHPDLRINFFLTEGGLPVCVAADEYSRLSAEALAAPNAEEGAAAYQEIEELALDRDHCFIPITQLVYSFGLDEEIEGFEVPYVGAPDWTTVRLG